MTTQKQAIWRLEILLFVTIVVLALVVLLPIYLNFGRYPFLVSNVTAIAYMLIALRFTFLFKHSFFTHKIGFKGFIMVLSIPLFMYFLGNLNDFLRFCDELGLQSLLKESKATNYGILGFIKGQYIFFVVSSLFLSIVFPLRMLISIWRVRNRNTV